MRKTTRALPDPAAGRPRGARTLIGLAAAALFLVAACQQGTTSTASVSPKPSSQPSSLAERAKKSAQPTSNPVRGAPRAPTPKPKPLPSGPSLSAVYATSLQVDAQHLIAANGARTTSCATTKDLPGCRSALQQVASAAAALQKDLDAHPAPTCMKAADTTLRGAVDLFQQGAQMGTQAIDQGSTAKLAQGRTLLDQAAARLLTASSQLGQAGCTVPPPNVAP